MTEAQTHDQRIVEQFTRWARPFSELQLHSDTDGMARLAAVCAASADTRVLDVACGPGIVACALAAEAAHVTGLDLTPAMIAEARKRQSRLKLPNIDWHVGDATALPFDDESFDVVVTRYSFHHLPRPDAALAQMKRVCRPGGRIVVVDATPSPNAQAAYDKMETLRDRSHVCALTLEQLRALGQAVALTEIVVESYRLEAVLSTLADEGDMVALEAMFDADIASEADHIGVGARRANDGIHFHFPISIVAWDRPT